MAYTWSLKTNSSHPGCSGLICGQGLAWSFGRWDPLLQGFLFSIKVFSPLMISSSAIFFS